MRPNLKFWNTLFDGNLNRFNEHDVLNETIRKKYVRDYMRWFLLNDLVNKVKIYWTDKSDEWKRDFVHAEFIKYRTWRRNLDKERKKWT